MPLKSHFTQSMYLSTTGLFYKLSGTPTQKQCTPTLYVSHGAMQKETMVYSIRYAQGVIVICFGMAMLSIHRGLIQIIQQYFSRLLHWNRDNQMIALVPVM